MQKYKSIKTFERITKIRPAQPQYELSTYKEIDEKFKEITDKTRQQLFPEAVLIESQKYMHPDDILQPRESRAKAIPESAEEFNAELQQKNQLQKFMPVHPMVQYFGSTIIATAFQSLILKSLEDTLKLKLNLEVGSLPLAQNVLKVFEINTNHLSGLKTQQEKNKYIMEQMNQVINNLLKQWNDKVYLKERRYRDLDNAYDTEAKNDIRQKQYKWLNLKTKYDELRIKLRQIIVDKLNDFENQALAIQALAERQDIKMTGGNPNKIKLFLKNVNIVTTRTIFENMEKFGQSKEFHFLQSLGPDRLQKIKKRKEQAELSNQKISLQQPKYDVVWDQNQEKIFRNQRSKTKQLFTNEVASSNWNDLGFLPILQQLNLQEKKKVQREHILNKYASGDWLTAQELQFLANTSSLLNACLDKDFFQKSTNIIDKDLLQNLELQLAENILCEYEEMKQVTQRARLQFIRQKIMKTKEGIAAQIVADEKKAISDSNVQHNVKNVRVFTTVIRYMERMGKFEMKIPDDVPGARYLYSYLQGRITQKELITKLKLLKEYLHPQDQSIQHDSLNKSIQKDRIVSQVSGKSQNPEQRAQYYRQMSRPKTSLTPGFRKEVNRHKYHPSSKLFLKQTGQMDQDDDKSGYMLKLKEKYNSHEQEKFQLHLKSHPALRQSGNFSNFYSGGPRQYNETRLFDSMNTNNPVIATQREIQAAILIQRKLRSILKEKKLRQQILNRRKDIYYFFKDNCEHLIRTIEFDRNDEAFSNMVLGKEIERAKEIARNDLGIGKVEEEELYIDEGQESNQPTYKNLSRHESFKRKGSQKQIPTETYIMTTQSNSSLQHTPTTKGSFTMPSFSMQKNQLKQLQLLEAAQKGKFMMMIQSKFTYSAQDVNIQNKQGDTALHMIVNKGDQEFIQWLLDKGADPNKQNMIGNTPLHNAFRKDSYQTIQLLMSFGANISVSNNQGQTPIHFASDKMLKLLQIQRVSQEATDSKVRK